MDFAARIRFARRKSGMTQAAVAEVLGISRGAVSNWEACGQSRPSTENLHKFSEITRVRFDWLLSGRGTMSPDAPEAPIAAVNPAMARDFMESNLLDMFRTVPLDKRTGFMEAITAMLVIVSG